MWSTNSLWFEVAIVSIIYAVGNIVFGHFEERAPKFRRAGKYIVTLIIVCLVSVLFGKNDCYVFSCCFFNTTSLYTRVLFAQEKGNQRVDG